MSELQRKIGRAVDRARVAWALCSGVALIGVVMFLPLWAIFFWLIISIFTYFGTLLLTAWLLAASISTEELEAAEAEIKERDLKEKLASGDHQPEDTIQMMRDAGIVDVVEVDEVGPEIGTFKGNPIYEYVLMKSPASTAVQKFLYHGPANVVNGMPEIPVLDDMIFAHIDGVLYYYKTEPENHVVQLDKPSV